jgi:GNAT superfamily N-acetyltransferase
MGIFSREPDDAVRIIEFKPKYSQAFKDLNLEWLTRYFEVEPYDEIVLGDPKTHIVDKGGFVFLAKVGEEIVGTCALIRQTDRKYELAKLAVSEAYQGKHVGRLLCEAAIEKAKSLGAATLVLATSTVLGTANRLYQRLGFMPADLEIMGPLPYKRQSIAMVMHLADKEKT